MTSRLNKILIAAISLTVLSIFLLPFSWVFSVEDDAGKWEKVYLIVDLLSLLFYLPFTILWSVYLMRTKVLSFVIFKVSLIVTAFATFIISFFTSVIPGQDYEPGWGVVLSLFIFPLFITFLVNRNILMKVS
jgi:hypothetical protein